MYRLAQLDDYTHLSRAGFPWRPPLTLKLEARGPGPSLPGTWGFGLWNDPFSLSLGLAGTTRRIPALPNTAWFFFASPPNYLSLREDLPAVGPLAATFQSPKHQWPWLLAAPLGLPLLLLPATARLLRRIARLVITQATAAIPDVISRPGAPADQGTWRAYQLSWLPDRVRFIVDGVEIFHTEKTPQGPLGLVIWIDNQYAALPPDGRLTFGTLETPAEAVLEIRVLQIMFADKT